MILEFATAYYKESLQYSFEATEESYDEHQ